MLKLHRCGPDPTATATRAGPDAPRERRRFRRTPLNQRVDLGGLTGAGGAEAIDGSAGGLFLRVVGGVRPEPGAELRVGLAAAPRGGTAQHRDDRRARVLRCLSHDGVHYVALRFCTPDALRIHAGLG